MRPSCRARGRAHSKAAADLTAYVSAPCAWLRAVGWSCWPVALLPQFSLTRLFLRSFSAPPPSPAPRRANGPLSGLQAGTGLDAAPSRALFASNALRRGGPEARPEILLLRPDAAAVARRKSSAAESESVGAIPRDPIGCGVCRRRSRTE